MNGMGLDESRTQAGDTAKGKWEITAGVDAAELITRWNYREIASDSGVRQSVGH
jgi:hypothetical protein